MNTAELVVEMRPEKNSGPHGISDSRYVTLRHARWHSV